MKRIPIIVDTDPGVDDFFCLAIAAAYDDLFDFRAVTTIGGNNTTDVTTGNALDILKLFHREDVPVARGADSYLKEEFGEPVAKFHGENGIGNVELEHSDRQIDPLCACDKIYEEAKKCGGELVLVTAGPETNLALAFQKHPDLRDMIAKITVMGGSLDTGNVTEYGEANLWHDAYAAKIVFETGIPIDMIGLNTTRKAPLRKDIFDGLDADEKIKNVMLKLIRFRNEEPMHDAIAISSLVNEKAILFRDAYTYIIEDGERRGMSVAEYDRPPNSRVAVDIDNEEYYKVIRDTICRLSAYR
jgi:inosine-uridine nucleoside N-ribohydrolase